MTLRRLQIAIRVFLLAPLILLNLNSAVVLAQEPPHLKAKNGEPALLLAGGIKAPKLVSRVDPEYPANGVAKSLRGKVVLWAVIETDGTVGELKLSKSLQQSVDEKVIGAVKRWTFSPASLNGKPVPILMQ